MIEWNSLYVVETEYMVIFGVNGKVHIESYSDLDKALERYFALALQKNYVTLLNFNNKSIMTTCSPIKDENLHSLDFQNPLF